MKSLLMKQSIAEFSDRELLFFVIANQVTIFRQTKYLYDKLEKGKSEGLGPFRNSIHELMTKSEGILKQLDEYLRLSDEEKGVLPI